MQKMRHGIKPINVLPLGFVFIILTGALLLMLPISSRDGASLPFINALFTATSASCVTGLVVVDTGTHFTLFGQIVILILIQLGGLGIMTISMILFSMTGRKISLHDRLSMAEGLGESRLQGIVRLARGALLVTAVFELLGAVLLSFQFIPDYGVFRGIWFSVFHSVSAFCNAGFDLLGGYRSMTIYQSNPFVLFIIMGLIVAGGLGFGVIINVRQTRGFRRLRLHSKIVLVGTLFMIVAGTLLFLWIEYENPKTIGNLPLFDKIVNSLFQSITLRTAGFNSIDQLALHDASKGVGILVMLVGGGPAGTAGGLKITTVFTLMLAARAYIRGQFDTVIFGRTISLEQVRRALTITLLGVIFLLGMATMLSFSEQDMPAGSLGLLNQLYEATSAFCTVGVSTGVSAAGSSVTRVLLILLMYAGRVGLVTVAMSLVEGTTKEVVLHYPQEEILIG
ncbi:MAG: Trk family potassium uptake protein [Eubacteriales bacterium]|nr:Trk family potassium uptake protein [Eubacteriales bacterium]